MSQFFIRVILVCACSIIGYSIISRYYNFPFSLIGALSGFLLSLVVLRTEQIVKNLVLSVILGGILGLVIGLALAYLATLGLRYMPGLEDQRVVPWPYLFGLLAFILGYLGLVLGGKKGEETKFAGAVASLNAMSGTCKILDTIVIIDGRMA